jgi:thiol-disulfide isomerase/thioredoxin/uncharacterized membrane protein
MIQQSQEASSRSKKITFYIVSLAILAGLILSVVSWLRICSEECAETHNYRLLGFPFEYIGLTFFPLVGILHLFSRNSQNLRYLVALLLVGALGAEAMLVLVQKYMIKSWCPVCLSIATCIFIAVLALFADYVVNIKTPLKQKINGVHMSNMLKGSATAFVFLLGFLTVFFGISKMDPLSAEENSVKQKIAFGTTESPISMYLFTDWECPACRQLEPTLEKLSPKIMDKARFVFIDFPVHADTLNFTPYNLSFMIYNKPQYYSLRNMLTEVSKQTGNPTEAQITEATKKLGLKYKAVNYSEVALALKYFKQLANQFDITGTPTLVIVNIETKKGKKLAGVGEINETNILQAIELLKGKKAHSE